MKKINLKLAATLMVCASFMFSSCVGSFGLHSRLLSWNQGIGDKWVNELVYLACNIVPVYAVCYLADALVINSIEFWSGSNPLADNIGTTKTIQGEKGTYAVTTLENGYSITKEGEDTTMELIYDKDSNTWNAVADGVSTPIMKINDDGTVTMTANQKQAMTLIPNAEGVSTYGAAVAGSSYFAAR